MGHLVKTRGLLERGAILAADLFATVFIYLVGMVTAVSLASSVVFLYKGNSLVLVWNEVKASLSYLLISGLFVSGKTGKGDILSLCFYTTLFSSLWAWAFALGLFFWPALGRASGVLDTRRHPVGVAMTIGGAFLGILAATVEYARILF